MLGAGKENPPDNRGREAPNILAILKASCGNGRHHLSFVFCFQCRREGTNVLDKDSRVQHVQRIETKSPSSGIPSKTKMEYFMQCSKLVAEMLASLFSLEFMQMDSSWLVITHALLERERVDDKHFSAFPFRFPTGRISFSLHYRITEMSSNDSSLSHHWEHVYQTKQSTEVSWYEESPQVSIDLIQSVTKIASETCVIDVGGGASKLVDWLLDEKYKEIVVLDLSSVALSIAQARLKGRSNSVRWIHGNVLEQANMGTFQIWHDRAVFHFLTSEQDKQAYISLLLRSVPMGSYLIVGTFALDGPEKCSNLPVCRYSAESLVKMFEPQFSALSIKHHLHTTPWKSTQSFVFVVMQRVS
jgi:SAM-dependent methyltransferase